MARDKGRTAVLLTRREIASIVALVALLAVGTTLMLPRWTAEEPVVRIVHPAADRASGENVETDKSTYVDINTATVADLELLPGIGPVKARAIAAYRGTHGRFATVDSLVLVRGIGPATLEKVRPFIGTGDRVKR